jgi:hypothetical protein
VSEASFALLVCTENITVLQGQVWPKIMSKINAEILGKVFFSKNYFCTVKREY